jgi:hypothetical protein
MMTVLKVLHQLFFSMDQFSHLLGEGDGPNHSDDDSFKSIASAFLLYQLRDRKVTLALVETHPGPGSVRGWEPTDVLADSHLGDQTCKHGERTNKSFAH